MTPDFAHCPEKSPLLCWANCPGLRNDHRCKQIAIGSPKWRRYAIERITGEPTNEPERKPLREASGLLVQMKACPHWVPRTDCGCGINFCSRDEKTVSRHDCFSCLKGGSDG